MMVAKGAWGWGMRQVMMDYNHWGAIALLGEILPWEDNRVELAAEKDRNGIPVAKVTFNLHDNDKKMIEYGKNKVMEIMQSAGAEEVVEEARYSHLVGGARMGNDPRTSVVDRFGRTHDIPNPFVCDENVMPTQGSANPGLTFDVNTTKGMLLARIVPSFGMLSCQTLRFQQCGFKCVVYFV
jgi:choline dehydrogenase-like flavoprotein